MQCPAMICRSLVGHTEWSLASARPRYLLAEQAAQHPKLPAAAVDAIRLAAGVVVADINEHQLQYAHMRHDMLAAAWLDVVMVLFASNAMSLELRSLLHVCSTPLKTQGPC